MTERQIERWWRYRRAQDKPSTLVKFCENSWRFLYYTHSFVFGLFVLWDKPWFWDVKHCWYGYPHQVSFLQFNIYSFSAKINVITPTLFQRFFSLIVSRSTVKYGLTICSRCHSTGRWLYHNSSILNAKTSGKCFSITLSHCCYYHLVGFVICIESDRWCLLFTIVLISFWKRLKSPNMQTIKNCAMESLPYSQLSGLFPA